MNFKKIKAMSWADLLKDHEFIDTYVTLYNTAHGNSLDVDGHAHYFRETDYLKQIILDSSYIAGCSTLSFMTLLLDLAYHGLSIQPISKPLAYVLPRKSTIKNADGTKTDELRAQLGITAYGEIALRIRSGIIKHVDNPVMVYKGDFFEQSEDPITRETRIGYQARYESEEIVRAFVKITRYDDTWDYKTISLDDMMRLKSKSDNKTGAPWTGGANGGPLRGMWETKVLKHAFNTYPRIKLGLNTVSNDEDFVADAAYASAMSRLIPTGQDDDDDALPPPTPKPTQEVAQEQPAQEKPQEQKKEAPDPWAPPVPPAQPVEISNPNPSPDAPPVYDFT